jgi:maleate isomerase
VSVLPESALALLECLRRAHEHERRSGVLVPWANAVIESELPRLGADSMVWHYARLMPGDGRTELDADFLSGIVAAVPSALAQLSALDVPLVQLGCTSAGFVARPRHSTPVPAGMQLADAFDAILHTLKLLMVRRIALLTPYPGWIGQREVESFRATGVDVVTSAHLGVADGYRHIKRPQITGLLETLPMPLLQQADGIVLSCTGWPTLCLLAELEQSLGKPVVSSNLAMAVCGFSLHYPP